MLRTGLVSLVLLTLISCNTSEIYVEKSALDKSIMVPPGLSPTAKAIKSTFREAGWTTYVTGGSIQTTGSTGKFVNINTKAKYPARYSAWAEGRTYDYCLFPPEPALHYDISIVDNVTGEEVAAFTGSACASKIGDEMVETLAPFL